MEKIKIGKGEVLHKKGDVVKSLEIILAGALQLTDGNGVEVRLDSGSLVGAVYQTGEIYSFDIVALMDCVLVVIDYRNEDSIAEAVMATPAIAPVMASASMALPVESEKDFKWGFCEKFAIFPATTMPNL